MQSIGIDAVDIIRFKEWHRYSKKQLLKIFTDQEIAYCLEISVKSAERFAAHFAAKEAFFKALSPLISAPIPFFTVCKNSTIVKNKQTRHPEFVINWNKLPNLDQKLKYHSHVSLTHTDHTAVAVVIIL